MPETLIDESPMPFGRHKGKRLADVPPEYFWWVWEGGSGPCVHLFPDHPLHGYIVRNFKRLEKLCPDYDPENKPPRDTRTATHGIKSWSTNPELPQPGTDY